jgi:NAD(P)-dependent dehydrogenase (short-subunit alcohol dehydrogenase family)
MEPRVYRIPRGAVGAPQDVAAAVLFLASAPHISGHILVLDGGQTAVRSAPYPATDD